MIWKFKKMLGEEKVKFVFHQILQQIKSKGIVKSFRRQAIDTVPILAVASLPSIIYLIYQAIKGVCYTVADYVLVEFFSSTDLTKEKLENYSKARPLFKLEDGDKIKAFEKSAKRGFQVLDIVHNKKLESEEITLLEEILQDNIKQKKNDEYEHKYSEHSKKSLIDKDANI